MIKNTFFLMVLFVGSFWACQNDTKTDEKKETTKEVAPVKSSDPRFQASKIENTKGEADAEWGFGFLTPTAGVKTTFVNFPQVPLYIYDAPNGERMGTIWKTKDGLSIGDDLGKTNPRAVELQLKEVIDKGICVKYFAIKDGYIQVKSKDDKTDYWLSLDKLKQVHFSFVNWVDFIVHGKQFYPVPVNGLNLRDTIYGERIVGMKGSQFEINPIGELSEGWMQVDVKLYDKGYNACSGGDVKFTPYKGWAKIMDDAGFPNVWFNMKGC